jgi:predicted RND superfamily exporter protein
LNNFPQLIVRFRFAVLALVVALTAFFTFQLKYLEVDSNIVDALPETDTVVQRFRAVGESFGSNEIGLVIIQNDNNVFLPQTLAHIQQVTDTLSGMEGIIRVTSLTNLTNFNTTDDAFEVDDLISDWPKNEADAEALKDEITANAMVVGTIVSEDATAAVVLFNFESGSDIKATATLVRQKIEALNLPEEVYFAGSTFLTGYVADMIRTDMARLIPIAFLLISFILFISFRSARGVILPILTAALAILWAIGTFVALGLKLSMVSNNVPIIILAVGSAYAIHVVNRVNQSLESDASKAIIESLKMIAIPVVLTALTTMVGFLSFVLGAYLSMIRDFGLLAALGTIYSAALALVFIPALLSLFSKNHEREPETDIRERKPFMYRIFLKPIYQSVTLHPKRILAIWVALFSLGVIGVFQLQRSVSVADYFKKSHPANKADRVMEAKFGGSKPLFVVFKGDVQSPELLNGMKNLSTYLLASDYVTSAQSVADVVTRLYRALGGETDIPEEKAYVEQLWFMLGQQDLSQLITEDLDQALIIAKFNNYGQAHIEDFNAYVAEYLKAHPSESYTIEISGMPYVNQRLDQSLVRSQLTSLLVAIVLVVALVSLIFKSVIEGLYASIPIIATIAILYGVMGLTGIPLNVVTVLVASVAMGIGIDYAIHYISHFNDALKRGFELNNAVEEAVMISGKAILINFISVSAGFMVLVFSDLMPMVYFGVLIALSMLGSSMGALTLLPAALILGKKRKFRIHTKSENA